MNYQEYRKSLNCKLTGKIEQELAAFREKTLLKSPEEIYKAAYQIVLKRDIAVCFSEMDFSPQAVKVLKECPNLLEDIYQEWLETDYSHMDDLKQTISDFKNYMVKMERILYGKER